MLLPLAGDIVITGGCWLVRWFTHYTRFDISKTTSPIFMQFRTDVSCMTHPPEVCGSTNFTSADNPRPQASGPRTVRVQNCNGDSYPRTVRICM